MLIVTKDMIKTQFLLNKSEIVPIADYMVILALASFSGS